MRSTFAGFTTAQLAMRASQKALDVTGQNIANINKRGYTRQRLDLMSLNSSMGVNKYESQFNVKIGNGVLTKGLSQIRDPFLDIRFRTESANVGTSDQKLVGLKDLELIFDEITKEGTQNQLSEITSMLQKLSSEVGNKEFDSMVRSSSDVFTKMLNQYAKQLSGIRAEQETNLDIDVMKVNDILTNIKELNKTIKNNHIHGNAALELQDERNLLIDELSSFMKIEVKYTPVQISDSTKVDRLDIYFVGSEGRVPLIKDDEFAAKVTASKNINSNKMEMNITRPEWNIEKGNELLKGIADLNEKIKKDYLEGKPTAETQKERSALIEELGQYMDIEVIEDGVRIKEINLIGKNNKISLLKNNEFLADFSKVVGVDGSVENMITIPPIKIDSELQKSKQFTLVGLDYNKVNNLLQQIDEKNKEIAVKINAGEDFSTLKSERTSFIDELKTTMNVNVKEDGDLIKEINFEYNNSMISLLKDGSFLANITPKPIPNLSDVNSMLSQINTLNETIKNKHSNGDPTLNLQLQRAELLESLSNVIDIETKIDGVEIKEINFVGSTNKEPLLISGKFVANLNNITNPDSSSGITISVFEEPPQVPPTTKSIESEFDGKFLVQRPNLEVDKANQILKDMESLNEEIKIKTDDGQDVSALTSQLNSLIKELGQYLNVEAKIENNQLKELSLVGSEKNAILLKQDEFLAEISKVTKDGVESTVISTTPISINDEFNDININPIIMQGRFKGSLDMLNKSGEFDNPPNTSRGIGYYEQSLDLLAAKFAESFNQMNRKPTFDAAGNITGYTDKDLFASFDGSATITARNITISEEWKNGTVDITASVKKDSPIGANDNILNMISMMSEKKVYDTPGGVRITEGSFQEMYTNMSTVLALDIKSTTSVLDNFTAVADDIANLRDDISSVSLDEEGMNILHYQKSYNAAARLMTALDEAIDTVINRMGVVGR